MTSSLKLGFGVGLLVCTVVYTSSANGFRNPPDGAANLGRAGAKTAFVDDASAVSINPANLATLGKSQVQAGVTFVDSDTKNTGPDGRSSDADGDVKMLPNIFAATPLSGDMPLVLGIGLTTPWGQSTEWPESSAVAERAPYYAELITVNVNPSVATRLGKHVLVGVGVDVLQAELDLKQRLVLGPGAPPTHVRLNGDGVGVGGNAGVTVELPQQQRLSATYRLPVKVDLDGDMDVTGFTGPLAPGSDFDSEIEFPSMIAAGYGIAVTPSVRLGVDVEWVEFSTFDELPLGLGANGAAGIFPQAVPQEWNDSWTYGVGGDWDLNETWTARGGVVYLETPIPEETQAPTLPDDDRFVYSAGFGYHDGVNVLDLAYAYSQYERTVDENLNPAFVGSYDVSVHLMQVSYARNF
ncbi:MAG: outer membrane protein transport protein [Lentisphaerae bacterium]|nr:outer membrane protein transport protein [Lentisphaerota bacterium]